MGQMIGFKCNKKESMRKHRFEFIVPEHVYIKIDKTSDLIMEPNTKVFKGSIMGYHQEPFKLPIISTVSGLFRDVIKENGSLYAVIENDMLEKYEKRQGYKRKITNYTKEGFVELLYRNAVIGQGGSGFPAYIKYATVRPVNHLIVNALECEPGITSDYETMFNHTENILDAVDAILKINKIDKATIAINSEYTDVIDLFHQYLGSYPEIELKVMTVKYPIGAAKVLVKEIVGDSFNVCSSEVGVIINNVSTIYNIYRALRYNRPTTEKVITITGDLITKPENVLVKIGMKANNLVAALDLPLNDNVQVINGGKLYGISYSDYNFVINGATIGMTIKKPEPVSSTTCINCGKCSAHCPMHVQVAVALKVDNPKYYPKCLVETCIACGLCSYVCPAKINLKDMVLTAKEEVSNEK